MTTNLPNRDISQPATEEPVLTYTAKQVAQKFQLPLSTVYLYAQTGELPSIKAGKRVLFPVGRMHRWLQR